jgi:hypothetical protein
MLLLATSSSTIAALPCSCDAPLLFFPSASLVGHLYGCRCKCTPSCPPSSSARTPSTHALLLIFHPRLPHSRTRQIELTKTIVALATRRVLLRHLRFPILHGCVARSASYKLPQHSSIRLSKWSSVRMCFAKGFWSVYVTHVFNGDYTSANSNILLRRI